MKILLLIPTLLQVAGKDNPGKFNAAPMDRQ
jgi:hypothetical protein